MFTSKIASLSNRLAKLESRLSVKISSDIQEEIIAILGGRANMASLIGDARIQSSTGNKGIIFAIPYVRGQGVTHIKIVLNDMGNYDVTFFAPMTGTTPKIKKAVKDVPSSLLLNTIERFAYLKF